MKPTSASTSLERVLKDLRGQYFRAVDEAHEPEDLTAERLLLVIAGGECFALMLVDVRELSRVPELVPLPGAPLSLVGVTSIRGRMVAVLDLAVLLGGAPAERLTPRARLLTLRADDRFALLCDAAPEVLRPSGAAVAGALAVRGYDDVVRGEIAIDDDPTVGDLATRPRLLHVPALLELARVRIAGQRAFR